MRPTLTCLTYTRLWTFSRHTYTVVGHRLWLPISHRAVGYLLAVAVPIWVLLVVFGVSFHAFGLTMHFVLPYLLARQGLKMAGVGQSPLALLGAWGRFGWHLLIHRGHAVRPVRISSRVASPLAPVPVKIMER